jgi:hypothetical protein
VVTRVDGAGDEGGGFGVSAGDGEEVGAWKMLVVVSVWMSRLEICIPMISA